MVGLRLGDETNTVSSIAGSLNATGWQIASGPGDHNTSTMRSYFIYLENSAAGAETVTITLSGSSTGHICCAEFPGVVSTSSLEAVDSAPNNSGTTTQHNSATLVAAGAGALIGFLSLTGSQPIFSGRH